VLDHRWPAAGRLTLAPGEDGRSDWCGEGAAVNIRALVGSGDRIGLVTLPFLVVGVVLNIAFPSLFTIGGPPTWLGVLSVLVLLVGVVNWAWCVYLLLIKVPRRELITNGPYAVVKHPLYTGAAPGPAVAGIPAEHLAGRRDRDRALVASRIFAPAEEVELAQTFGPVWDAYTAKVKLPWL
jgi:protein-S-isoprenylcysteine O-methyltransferase Ste14